MYFSRLIALSALALNFSYLIAVAQDSPLNGAWAALDKNSPGLEAKACAAVAKFGLARLSGNTIGEVVAFTSNKRLDFGGYADTESTHISMTREPSGNYVFRDRWYDDGEGGGREGLKVKTYSAKIIDPLKLEIREGKIRTHYVKCVPPTVTALRGPDNSRPPQKAETGEMSTENRSSDNARSPQIAETQQTTSPKSNSGNPQTSEVMKPQEPIANKPSVSNSHVSQRAEVQEASTTKFRGLFIGMTRSDVEKLGSGDFLVKFEKADPKANPCNGSKEASCQIANSMGLFKQSNKATITLKNNDKACAEVIFDKDERVDQMTFSKCFFGASDLEFQPFAQAIVNNYNISNLSCKSDLDSPLAREYARSGVGPSNPRTCSGLAKTGEKVTVTTGGFIQPDMTVEKTVEKPTFN